MSFLARLFNDRTERQALRPLYDAVVAEGRAPDWYRDAGVPDTMTGRFDTVSSVLAMVLLRLEREGEAAQRESILLTEVFIDDMDANLRESGTGDLVVGKRIGKLMGLLGGRLGAYRDALAGEGDFEASVRRNMYRDAPPSPEAVEVAAGRLRALHAGLAEVPMGRLIEGHLQ
ncbi:MAG TPA: ubiquinol-cytochrome C chaperone family protein [Allosphingosinicella sp.]|nr:ubiquinol-cytochrome C chaperone family protein [Allosphingosinicella sp.]